MNELAAIFDRIRSIFERHADRAVPHCDEPERYYLDTYEVREKDGYRTAFGGVEIKKNYVSAHLMPVYAHPELLDDVSPELRKRMQGKSCFNFKKKDEALFAELDRLVRTGAEVFAREGRLAQSNRPVPPANVQ